MRVHPSHETRFSDSSFYDEVCVHCNATDSYGGTLDKICSFPKKVKAKAYVNTHDKNTQETFTYLESQVLYLDYTNWRGERSWRRVVPLSKPVEYLDEPNLDQDDKTRHVRGWVLRVFDLDKQEERSYLIKDIHDIYVFPVE